MLAAMLFFPTDCCVMDHAISRRPVTAKARVQPLVGICGIYGAQNITGTSLCPSTSVLPCQYLSTIIYLVLGSLHNNQQNVSVMN